MLIVRVTDYVETCQPAYGGNVLLATYSEGESLKTGEDCQTIPVNNCRNVAKPNCRQIADEQCRKVPNRECGRVPVKKCRQVSAVVTSVSHCQTDYLPLSSYEESSN